MALISGSWPSFAVWMGVCGNEILGKLVVNDVIDFFYIHDCG